MKPGSIVRAVCLLLCLAWASPERRGADDDGRIQGRGPDGEEIAGATVTAGGPGRW
jgi:hypothetical protein